MKPSVAMQGKQAAIREAVKRHRTGNPRVFGSGLDGSDEDGSDLDLLVDPLPGTTLFDLGGLTEELTELLGIPVNVRTPQELPEAFRDRVVAKARPV